MVMMLIFLVFVVTLVLSCLLGLLWDLCDYYPKYQVRGLMSVVWVGGAACAFSFTIVTMVLVTEAFAWLGPAHSIFHEAKGLGEVIFDAFGFMLFLLGGVGGYLKAGGQGLPFSDFLYGLVPFGVVAVGVGSTIGIMRWMRDA